MFPADESSLLWRDANENWDAVYNVEAWKRLSELYGDGKKEETYTLFGSKGVNPEDILQGSIGNCWFMSAISAIAEEPGRVEKMFLNTSNAVEPKGIYGVNMFALGVPITIIVDDYIPTYEYDTDDYRNLFAGAGTDFSVWGAVIEKAFAKFHGNYKHIVGGIGRMAVRTLVGGPFEDYWHNDKDGNVITSADDLWDMLAKHDAAG